MKEGKKFDQDKLRWDLVPWEPLEEVVKVFTFGAKKYGDRNWEQGIKWLRIFAAQMRHLSGFRKGEKADHESGLHPLAHVAWGCLCLMEYENTRKEFDDRVQPSITYKRKQGKIYITLHNIKGD